MSDSEGDAYWTLTPKEAIRKNAKPIITSLCPDVCKTPIGSSVVPIPYNIISYPKEDVNYSQSVRMTGQVVMHLKSKTSVSYGDEAGTAKGIKSGTVGDVCEPLDHSTTVRVEGNPVIRNGDKVYMNARNTIGIVQYVEDITTHGGKYPAQGGEGFEPAIASGAQTMRVSFDCRAVYDTIIEETEKIANIEDPLERNKAINKAYDDLAKSASNNHWIKLASYVSPQGGCAMQKVLSTQFDLPYQALGEANKAIFKNIYPVMKAYDKYGAAAVKRCYAGNLPAELEEAIDLMEQDKLEDAALKIAEYEQRDVVQKVYEDYDWTFRGMEMVDRIDITTDHTSIPVSRKCGVGTPVPFKGSISEPNDRVNYYKSLMQRMKEMGLL